MNDIDKVKCWINSMSKKGIYQESRARMYITALNKIIQDKTLNLHELLSNLEDFGRQYEIKYHANPGTVKDYLSRTKRAIEDYLDYHSAPMKFKVKKYKVRSKDKFKTLKQIKTNNLIIFKNLVDDFLQRLPMCEESLSADEVITFFLQLLPRCEEGISGEQWRKLTSAHITLQCMWDKSGGSRINYFEVIPFNTQST